MGSSQNFTRLLDQQFKEYTYLLWLFSLATFSTAVLALISLPLNILSIKVLLRCKQQVPDVVRRFVIIYNLALLQRLIMINWKWLYQICSLFFGFERIRFPAILCKLFTVLYSSPYYVFAAAIFGMSLERFVTSYWYINILQSRIFVAICAILGWSIPFSKTIIQIVNRRIVQGQAPYCQGMFLKKEESDVDTTTAAVIAQLSLLLISLCLMCFIKWLNKKRLDQFNLLSTTHNLALRFTLWSNFNTSKWLIPVTLINLVFRIASEIIQLIFQGLQDQNAQTIGIGSCTLLLAAVESFVYPVALFRYNETFGTSLLDMNLRCLTSKHPLSQLITGRKANAVGVSFRTREFSRAVLNTVEFRQKPQQNADIVMKMWERAELDLKGSKTICG